MANTEVKKREKKRGAHLSDYIPLVAVLAVTAFSALAKQYAYQHPLDLRIWMADFMGFFLVTFSLFKFFDLDGFVDGFQMYDLLAKSFRPYAYAYPFIELGLGLCYLAQWQLFFVYLATIFVLVWGSVGVVLALAKGLDLECACMGSILHVPLSTVALVEDLGMAAMAFAMLLMSVSIL